jgi:hypothetical protein
MAARLRRLEEEHVREQGLSLQRDLTRLPRLRHDISSV